MNVKELFQPESTGDICPACGDEITVSTTKLGQVELECPCGCSLAVA